MIKVIEENTTERRNRIRKLYEDCKPYLDQGYSLHKAVWLVTGTQPNNTKNGYYRELIEYSQSQGYDYYGNRWNRVKVIERTTSDVDKETSELFEKCRPLLDQGYGFYKALRIIKNIPETSCFGNASWYKRFKEYAESQGYYPLR